MNFLIIFFNDKKYLFKDFFFTTTDNTSSINYILFQIEINHMLTAISRTHLKISVQKNTNKSTGIPLLQIV